MNTVTFGYLLILLTLVVVAVVSIRKTVKSSAQNRFTSLFTFWFVVSAIFCIAAAFWPVLYSDLRLSYLGAGVSTEPAAWLDTVAPEHKEEAKALYWSNSGVGWPLVAFAWFVIVSLPWSVLMVVCAKAYAKLQSIISPQQNS